MDVKTLHERLVDRAVIGRQRAKKLDSTVDASRRAAEEFVEDLYAYIVARLREEGL